MRRDGFPVPIFLAAVKMVAPGRQKIRSAGGRQVLCSCDRIGPRRFLIHECWFKSCRAASPTDGGGSDQLQLCSGGGKKKTPSPSSLGRLFRRPAARGPVAAAAATKSYLYEAACSSESGLPDNGPAVCQWADCDKHFAVRTELIQHVHRQHCLHKAPYACRWAVCQRAGRPFAARYMFAAHMRMHTGERPYKCSKDGCGKAYSQYENLKTHLRGHSGEKPYNCKYCGKAFSNASDRAKHQNHTHIRDRMFECTQPDCDKKYTERSSLRKHLRTAHFIVKRQTDRQSVIRRGGASIMNVELASTSSSPTDLGANGELSVADLSGAEKLP